MKELSIKQKAEAYDEVRQKIAIRFGSNVANEIFSQFEMSEDEKIRKNLITCISTLKHPLFSERERKEFISWLEKQTTPQARTGLEWENTIDDACDTRYTEEYSHDEYCHEQSFKWGFKEGVDWLEKQGEQKELNLVEILKHYPRETELYSPLYGKLWLAEVDEENEIITCYKYPLDEGCTRATLEQEDTVSFYSNGTTGLPDCTISKDCMLFLYDIEKQGEHTNFLDKIQIGDKVTRNKDGVLVNLSQLNRVAKKDEKQGEQKPANKVESKFHEGDWIIHQGTDNIYQVVAVIDDIYRLKCGNNYTTQNCTDVERCARLWDITKDAKDGDILNSVRVNATIIFKGFAEDGKHILAYCALQKGIFIKQEMLWDRDFELASKYWKNALYDAMTKAGYEWDTENKQLKKIEEKPIEKAEPKFKVGDWVVGANNVFKIISLNNELNCYIAVTQDNNEVKIPYYFDDAQGHMCSYHLWTIADVKNGDVLVDTYEKIVTIVMYHSMCTKDLIMVHCCFDNKFVCQNLGIFPVTDVKPATKEQRDTLMKAMADAGYEFDFEKKELRKIEQNPALNEEDIATISRVISIIKWAAYSDHSHPILNDKGATELVERLESIKDKVQPKQEWSEKDRIRIANCIQLIGKTGDGEVEWLKSLESRILPQTKPEWSEEDEKKVNNLCIFLDQMVSFVMLGNKDATEFKDWLKSLKYRVQPQSKQEWSNEDKETLDRIISNYQYFCKELFFKEGLTEVEKEVIKNVDKEDIDWLKSLIPQNRWKPSDEQIKAVRLARSFVTDDLDEHPTLSETLIELEEQLKKLRGK